MRFCILILSVCCSSIIFAEDVLDRQQMEKRIQPIGTVSIQGTTPSLDQKVLRKKNIEEKVEKKDRGQVVYEQYCIVCHRDGLAGAPKFSDVNDWKPRLEGKTIDDLIVIVNKGLNVMPPKGTCSECTDDDIKAAIQYMLPKS